MEYPYNVRKYINEYPDFVKFLNKENDKLDDVQYSKLFFDAINKLHWYSDCVLDILRMHVFKPKFEKLFIIGLVSESRWSNQFTVQAAINAIKLGLISSEYYDDIMTMLLAKTEDCVSAASLYNVEGFKKYNGIIEAKCMGGAKGNSLIEIIQNDSIDINIKYIALDKIIEKNRSYVETAIDAICSLDEDRCKKLMDSYMDKLISKDNIYHFCMMVLGHDIKLNYNIAKKIHDKYGIEFFNENIRHFEKMRRYCFSFGNCLTEEERNTIFKRLQTKTRRVYINDAITRINFTEDQKNKLQSYALLYDLAA